MGNVLDAIMNIITDGTFEAKRTKDTINSVNQKGDPLEEYIKDAFAGTFMLTGEDRMHELEEKIAYHGNSSNPPDMIIAGTEGIAIEVKKSDSYRAALQLNSSMPHGKLSDEDARINEYCKKILCGKEYDMLYVIGAFVKGQKKIKHLAMVYGSVYCADIENYRKIDCLVRAKIQELSDILIDVIPTARLDLESNELGKLKCIDPRGHCDLRVRGMYTYASPYVVFNEEFSNKNEFDLFVVIPDNVFQGLTNKSRFLEFINDRSDVQIEMVDYLSPNNDGTYISCQKIIYEKKKK